MRVGLLFDEAGPDGDVAAVVEQIAAADALGFDTVWIADHPVHEQGLGSPAIVLAALAKQTHAIRLGSFQVLPLAHPARTAEDFAMIDLLSGGRLNFGAAAGADEEAFRAYHVPFAERAGRFREALDLILAAWTFDEFAYGGRYYRFPAHVAPDSGLRRKRFDGAPYVPQWERGPELPEFLTVTPKPLQQPRPPVWVFADAPEWVTFAAECGHCVVLPAAKLSHLEAAAHAYEADLARARRARSAADVAVIVDVDDRRPSRETVADLHRLRDATGANQVIWRIPSPHRSQRNMAAALRRFAAEVQPLLQA